MNYNSLERKGFEALLIKEFPIIYRDMYGDMRETCMAWGCDIGAGWYTTLYYLSANLERIAKTQPLPKKQNWFQKLLYPVIGFITGIFISFDRRDVLTLPIWWCKLDDWFGPKEDYRLKFSQIKEKFGIARFYLNNLPQDKHLVDEIDLYVDSAEKETSETCEVCGEFGSLRNDGWMRTLCDKHEEERKC